MKTLFAVNYSHELERLVKNNHLSLEMYKLPAWPNFIDRAKKSLPIYIHFPLMTGRDIFQSIQFEGEKIGQKIELLDLVKENKIEKVNLHIGAIHSDIPEIPQNAIDKESIQKVLKFLIEGCQQAIEVFGAENVIVENNIQGLGYLKAAACLPEVISQVVEETGCGFLFDLSHARLSAEELGMDPIEYIKALPLDKLYEMHITGIQVLDDEWMSLIRKRSGHIPLIEKFAGKKLDHLPLIEEDWEITRWSMDQIKKGYWKQPRIAAFEYGGVGDGYFSATVDEKVLLEQVPRLSEMIKELNT